MESALGTVAHGEKDRSRSCSATCWQSGDRCATIDGRGGAGAPGVVRRPKEGLVKPMLSEDSPTPGEML
jgi:hypothetical protein